LELSKGDRFTVSVRPGEFELTRATGSSETVPGDDILEIGNPTILPIRPSVRAKAGIGPGDIVRFDLVSNRTVRLTRIEAAEDPSFTNVIIGDDGLPIPPEWLIACFFGRPDLPAYVKSGRSTWAWLQQHMGEAGLDFRTGTTLTILDFGCGCARVSRMITATRHRVLGCDLHGPAIEWCQRSFPGATFFHGFEQPPVPLEDGAVDFLFGVSVLTHLDEPMQAIWLDEWRRLVKPGGFVFTTFIGSERVLRESTSPEAYRRNVAELIAANDGIAFLDNKAWKGVFPDFYQTTVQSTDHVRRTWSKYFEIVSIIASGGFVNAQDAVIMRRSD
jgi:SAM-dependent methyltransferase